MTDAFTSLGDAVRAGGQAGSTRTERIIGDGQAYRRWAHEHRPAFLLALGAPLPDYAAPEDGPTTLAATRMGEAFQDVVFDGWTADEVRAVQLAGAGPAAPGEGSLDDGPKGLPPGALALFAMGWSGLHGFVVLEVSGHLGWLGDTAEQTCVAVLSDYAAVVRADPDGSSQP